MEDMKEWMDKIENVARDLFVPEQFYSPTITDEFLSYLHGRRGGIYPRWLAAVVKVLKPETIVELGNRQGISTAAIISGMCSKKQIFYSVDIIRDLRYVSDRAKSDDRFKWVIGDCLDLSIFSTDEIPKNINLIFLDTIHTYEQVKNEFYVWEPLLADKCLVAIDDIRLNDKGKFFDEMSYRKYDLTHLCHTSGFGIFFYQRTDRGSVQEAIIRSCMVMTRRNKEIIQDLYQKLNKLKASLPYRVCHKLYKVYHKLSGSELEE